MKNTKHKGFTLIETLVALTILITVISAAFSAAQSGISLSTFSKNQIIAFYLASEGVEQIRNMRDENGLNNRDWLSGISSLPSDPCYLGRICMIDAIIPRISSCGVDFDSCPVLKEDIATGFYGYNPNWKDTIFKRGIKIVPINSNEISVTVSMSWSQGILDRQFEIRENLLNWH